VKAYLSAHHVFTPYQLVLINGGANDILFQLEAAQAVGTPQAKIAALEAIVQSAIDLSAIVASVVEKGATHVLVMNLPDVGKTPAGLASPDHGRLLTEVSQIFNFALATALAFNQQNFGGKVILIDAFSFADKLIANYQTYGFVVSNTGIACNLSAQASIAAGLCLKNPGSLYCVGPSMFGVSLFCSRKTYTTLDADYAYIFADLIHPTTHTNQLFARYVEQQIAAKRW
jgi:phospholipase/lecithinase/hemolysin